MIVHAGRSHTATVDGFTNLSPDICTRTFHAIAIAAESGLVLISGQVPHPCVGMGGSPLHRPRGSAAPASWSAAKLTSSSGSLLLRKLPLLHLAIDPLCVCKHCEAISGVPSSAWLLSQREMDPNGTALVLRSKKHSCIARVAVPSMLRCERQDAGLEQLVVALKAPVVCLREP